MQGFVIALGIGLVIGMEREKAHGPGAQALGVRSFAIVALLGAIAAYFRQPMLTALLLVSVGTLVALGYYRSTRSRRPDVGLTTELAALFVFGLGYLVAIDLALSLFLSVVLLVLLVARSRLHHLIRKKFTNEELNTVTTLLVLFLVALTLVPD